MAPRYLFGPTSAEFADQNLFTPRAAGDCRAFSHRGGTDLSITNHETWESLVARLPDDWRPDFLVLNLAYQTIPPALWSAPVPIVALAGDWPWLFHGFRRVLPCCDLVFTDPAGVDAFRRAGFDHALPANLYGLGRAYLEAPAPQGERDWDVVFVGNLHPAVQRERLAWLGRLARLAEGRRVLITSGVFGDDYRELLRRSRIVFNRSARGECNQRALEATACGALLFQERGNAEVAAHFRDRQECVFYGDDDLEDLLEHYLTHEDERRAIAEAGRQLALSRPYVFFWNLVLQQIERRWPELQERVARRPKLAGVAALLARTEQSPSSMDRADLTLTADLEAALPAAADPSALHNALGVAVAVAGQTTGVVTAPLAEQAAGHFRDALAAEAANPVAALNLVEALVGIEQTEQAIEGARRTLALLARDGDWPAPLLDAAHFPPGFDLFRVEWERAAWENAGRPRDEARAKVTLLRWRLHALLADLTGDLAHFQEAARLQPDLPVTRAALGCALGRAGRPAEAVPHLRRAVADNPFDLAAARSLFHALGEAGDTGGQGRFAHERRLLARAAPRAVPAEPWFAAGPGPAPPSGLRVISADEFRSRFGVPDTARAVHSYTPPQDTHAVLTLLAHARPRRILEVGTAAGHMTANLTEWSPDDAVVYTLGTVAELHPAAGPQADENPPRSHFGRCAGHFGKADKVFFVTADSLRYDFRRLGPLDFVFLDGAHDLEHVLSDTRNAYRQLVPGGCLVWHDVGSSVAWVEVDQALARAELPEPIYHVAGTGVAFLHKRGGGREAPGPVEAAPGETPRRPSAVVWEGPLGDLHSLALVNRELCLRLAGRGHELSLAPVEIPAAAGVPQLPLPPALAGRLRLPLGRPVEAHVCHTWPPHWAPPPSGHWVLIQPWEFGSLPRAWVGPLSTAVDEVWVYTRFVRDCFVQSGVPADRVHVVPLGADPAVYHPGARPYPLRSRQRFRFLFVGGTLYRKGIDLLLDAYAQTFTARDDVCLVVKDMGVNTFYRGQTAQGRIAQLRETPGAPAVEYLDGALSGEEMAGLYAACDCLAHPYRGEGFGLPVAEAMACGLPVLVTNYGACLDFCDEGNAFLVPARLLRFPEKRVGALETVDYPWLAEPDPAALGSLLRYAYEHPAECRAKGAVGRERVHARLTWDRAADAVERRLAALRQRPPRRFAAAAGPVGPVVVAAGGRPRVSLCMIVKDEEDNLPACLASVADLVDEVVVVDTGSTDNTKEVAAQFNAQVVDFPWVDSFSAARNEGLRHATGQWIFWMDADDRLDADNREKLRALFASLRPEKAAYSMKCLCLPDAETGTATVVDHIRLFRNDPALRWEHRVHEQILPALRRLGADVRFADVVVHHAGYQDRALRQRKLQRDLRLLELERTELGDHPFTLFNLGSVYQEQGRHAEALAVLRKSLERSHPSDSIVRKLYALIVSCHRAQGQLAEAVAACQEGRGVYPDDAELLFNEALLRREQRDLAGAEACLKRLLSSTPGAHFASVDAGLRGYKARQNLGVIYREQGRLDEAEAEWRAVTAERPDFLPAWLALAELHLAQQRWSELDEVVRQLEAAPHGRLEAAVLAARGALARREFSAARQRLERTIAEHPQALWPRVILSHVLLQEGRDLAAAEQALRAVLALDPDHAEACSNLSVLLRQRRAADAVFTSERLSEGL